MGKKIFAVPGCFLYGSSLYEEVICDCWNTKQKSSSPLLLAVGRGLTVSFFINIFLERQIEGSLLSIVETESYDVVRGRITAKTLMRSDNPLSLAIQVSPFMVYLFSFCKCFYSYKLQDLHFFLRF